MAAWAAWAAWVADGCLGSFSKNLFLEGKCLGLLWATWVIDGCLGNRGILERHGMPRLTADCADSEFLGALNP